MVFDKGTPWNTGILCGVWKFLFNDVVMLPINRGMSEL